MLVPDVDRALEALLRRTLPLADHEGDISFDTPTSTWSAQVNRLTVNLFLHQVARSPQPPRPAQQRPGPDGRLERRPPQPLVELSYLVSAWAGSVRDEHQLLGEALTRLLGSQALPAWAVPDTLTSSVQVAVRTDDAHRPRDLWGTLGSQVKASFGIVVTVVADVHDWELAPPQVTGVEAATSVLPRTGTAGAGGAGSSGR